MRSCVPVRTRASIVTFAQMSRIRFKCLFHGTSSVFRQSIENEGLLPVNGVLHLTTDPSLAWDEANWTVSGEDQRHGYKIGVGGKPLIVTVDRNAVSCLRIDSPGWYDKNSYKVRRLVAKRVAFRTESAVSPVSLSFIDSNFEAQLERVFDEIHEMTKWRLPFQYHPRREAEILAELKRRRASSMESLI
jgi:hypothetical protein